MCCLNLPPGKMTPQRFVRLASKSKVLPFLAPVINNGRENIHVLTGDSIMSLTVTPHNSLTLQRKVLENMFRSTSDSECVTLLIVEVVKYCCYVFPGLSNTVALNW